MSWRRSDETFAFEGHIEFVSQKAYLVEMTLGGLYWVPKSQVVQLGEADIDGNRDFTVTDWWWGVRKEAHELEG